MAIIENASTEAGGKLKETGTAYWTTPNTGSTNEVNFNAMGAGWRNATGSYQYLNERNYILSTTYALDSGGLQLHKYFLLKYDSDDIFDGSSFGINPRAGISIRLIYTGSGTPTSYTGNDGKVYRVVTINGITYLADNLAETKYRNGDWITGYDGGTYTPISNANWAAKTTEAMCIYGDVESNMLL